MTKRAKKRSRMSDETTQHTYEQDDDSLDEEEPTTLPRSRKKKRRRAWPFFSLLLLGLICGTVLLAPTLISLTPLGPNMVQAAAKDQLRGSLQVQSVSFGWFSPVRLTGVVVNNAEGQTLGVVKSITVNKSLLALLGDRTKLDVITVEEPQLQLVLRPDGSNLEDLLAPLLKQPATGGTLPEFTVQVNGATLDMLDSTTQESWQFTPLAAQVISPRAAAPHWQVQVESKLRDAALFATVQHAAAASPTVASPTTTSPTTVELRTDKFPLASLRPLLARFAGEVSLAGTLTGKVNGSFDAAAQPRELRFEQVEAQGVRFAAPLYTGREMLAIEHCKAQGNARYEKGVWQLQDLQLESDVAALAGNGDVRVSDFTSGQAFPQTDCNIRGVVDLAKLVRMFPASFKVREGVEIVSGRANVILVSHAAGAGRRFEASLTLENLQARNQGQLVALGEPVALGALVTQSTQGWQIEKLDARSSFLTADVTGSPAEGRLEVRGDLQRLREELARFFDLTGVKLSGAVTGDVAWRTAGPAMNTDAELKFTRLSVEMPEMLPWHEDELRITLAAEGIQPATGSYAVAKGEVHVASEQDKLAATLREPVRRISAETPLPVKLQLSGDLASWLPRLQAFVPVSQWRMSGPVELTADANISASRVEAPQCKFKVQQLQAEGHGLYLREPVVQGETQFTWDAATQTALLANTMLQSTSLAAAAEKLQCQLGEQTRLEGTAALRGDLGKLLAWFSDPAIPVQMKMLGELEAEARFHVEQHTTRANLSGKVTNLALTQRVASAGRIMREASAAPQWQTVWSEPQVVFGGEAAYDAAADKLTLNQFQTKAGTSVVATSGSLSELATRCVADLKGDIRYDLASLTPLGRPYLGETFRVSGVTSQPFELRGPLWSHGAESGTSVFPAGLTGKAGMNWEAASWMALEMGPGQLMAELQNATVRVQPTSIPLSQGTVNLSPTLLLNGPQWQLSQDKVKLIDHVVITPEMCNQWVLFVAPLLAGTTEAQGQFSVELESGRVPLQQVSALSAKGLFTVHRVSVGPGPLAREIIGVADQLKAFVDGRTGIDSLLSLAQGNLGLGGLGNLLGPAAEPAATAPATSPAAETPGVPVRQWLELPEQQVPVHVVDGRVHHQGLSMQVKDVVIRTSGSVGIVDQSLSLVAEIPILDDWIKNKRELAVLKGQTIQIPISGSVVRPRLDTRGLLAFGKNFAFQSASGLVNDQVNRGLEQGTGAVQSEVGKVQNKISEELQRGKSKLESELRDGLKGIFGS
jgi:hypothetical protein